MQKKVVLITGGTSGIGKTIGLYLQKKGFTVYGTTRNLAKNAHFNDFELLELDVRNSQNIQSVVTELIKKEGKIDILINNAGIGIIGPIEETPHNQIENTFNINFHGPLKMIQAVLPQMRKQKTGHIINITSIAGYIGLPYRGIYSATKGAVELITETLRIETKEFGIKVASIAPGSFCTNIAAGRFHVKQTEKSSYKKAYSKTMNKIDESIKKGKNPIKIAKKVHEIINSSNPKGHYVIGAFLERFSLTLKKILPYKMYEILLKNHYKL